MDVKEQLEIAAVKIDALIEQHAPPPVKAQLKALEDVHPLLKQAHVVGGLLFLPVLLAFYLLGGFKLMVNLSCFLYPAYKSLQAISVTDPAKAKEDEKQWLSYWLVYGTFGIIESGMSFLVTAVPYYNVFKLGLFVYLYHSSTKGATKVYDTLLVPYVAPFITSKTAEPKSE